MAIPVNIARGARESPTDSSGLAMSSRPDPQTIAIASDHADSTMKAALVEWMRAQGHAVEDLGPYDTISVDYPDYGYKLGEAIASGAARFGVLVCGSGIGISIAANRNPARALRTGFRKPFRAACALTQDANVIAFGARLIGPDQARDCLSAFLARAVPRRSPHGKGRKLGHPRFAKEPA